MPQSIYESQRLLDEYLLFHFGSEQQVFAGKSVEYPQALRSALGFTSRTVGHFSQQQVARGLDLGCAVGGSTFAMAEHCDEVIGIDFSQAFVHAAQVLQAGRSLAYDRHDEGHCRTLLTASLSDNRYRTHCHFEQGDAMNLRADLGSFDRVHAANLLCRLAKPQELLATFPALVRPGGELVIATPCTWLEQYTASSHWPPGETLTWLQQELAKDFEQTATTHEPFLIRETARKFQWSQSLVTVWRRR